MDVRCAAIAAVLLAACGYASQEETRALEKDIATLKAQSAKQEEQAAELREQLRKAAAEADAQVQKLQALVDEATKVVTRNSANLGQDVDKLKVDQAALAGRLDELSAASAALTKSFNDFRATSDTKLEQLTNATTVAKAPPIPESPDGVFAEAQKRMEGKQWNDARRLFDAFIARYPGDQRAATAQFLIGYAYLNDGKHANAIGAFSKVIDNFPKSEIVPDAMYKSGTAFYALKYCGDARIYFQELLRRYPKTEWKKDANEQLRKLQKELKNKELCQQG